MPLGPLLRSSLHGHAAVMQAHTPAFSSNVALAERGVQCPPAAAASAVLVHKARTWLPYSLYCPFRRALMEPSCAHITSPATNARSTQVHGCMHAGLGPVPSIVGPWPCARCRDAHRSRGTPHAWPHTFRNPIIHPCGICIAPAL